jgi:hypothetical protein
MKVMIAALTCLAAASATWAKGPRPQQGQACNGAPASYALTINGANLITAPAMSEAGNAITLSRFHGQIVSLSAWRQQVQTGGPQSARKNVAVAILDQRGHKLGQLDLVGAWPSKLTATGPGVGSGSADALIESITLTFARERKTCN